MTHGPEFYVRHDASGLLRGVEAELDRIDEERAELLRHLHGATAARMRSLGLDDLADKYEPLPFLHDLERRTSRHPTEADYATATRVREPVVERDPPLESLGRGVVVTRGGGTVLRVR